MSITAPLRKSLYSELSNLYLIPKEQEGKVWIFLDEHQSLTSLLESIPSYTNELFPNASLELSWRQDPEIEDYKFLRIKIISQLNISEAQLKKQDLNNLLFDQWPSEILSLLLITTCSE